MSEKENELAADKPLPEGYYLQLLVSEDTIDLLDIWETIKAGKWLVLLFLVVFVVLGFALSLVIPRNYEAEVVVASTDIASARSTSGSNSSDTLDLTVNIPSEEAMAMIESRIFVNQFIEQQKMLPILFAKRWDKGREQWISGTEVPTKWDAYEMFVDDMLDVKTDAETGLTTVSIKWTDAEQATLWVNKLIEKINGQLRDRAISEAETSINYLNEQLVKTSTLEIQQALYGLMEVQLAKIVAAKVQEEFAFRVVDPALVPEEPAVPHLVVILISLSAFFGIVVGMSVVWFRHSLRVMAANRQKRITAQ